MTHYEQGVLIGRLATGGSCQVAEHRFELSVLALLFVLAGIPMIWLSPDLGFYFDLLGFVLSYSGLLLFLFLVNDSSKNELRERIYSIFCDPQLKDFRVGKAFSSYR